MMRHILWWSPSRNSRALKFGPEDETYIVTNNGEPINFDSRDVLYGWCSTCRDSHFAEYKKVEGWAIKIVIIATTMIRRQCTYCGGDVEDTFSTAGILAACFLFPIGGHLADMMMCDFLKYSIQKSSNRNRSLLLPETSPLCCLHKRSHLKGRKMFPVYKIKMPGYIFLFDGHNKQDMGKDIKVQNKNWRGFTQNDMRCAPESQHIL